MISAPTNVRVAPGPPPPVGAHGYFNTQAARPDVLAAYSLRSQSQLVQYKHANSLPPAVNYVWPNDPDPRAQDAAKAVIPITTNSLPNQLRVPFSHGAGPFTVSWEVYWTEDFFAAASGLSNHKAFMLASPAGTIRTEIRARYTVFSAEPAIGAGAVARVDVRPYSATEVPQGPADKLMPLLTAVDVYPNRWTRYWVRHAPRNDGSGWWNHSLWVADALRPAVQCYSNAGLLPAAVPGGWQQWWIELNTSTDTIKPGRPPLVVYVRNTVITVGDQPKEQPI